MLLHFHLSKTLNAGLLLVIKYFNTKVLVPLSKASEHFFLRTQTQMHWKPINQMKDKLAETIALQSVAS